MKTILFLCHDNSALSQIAQAHAIRHGKNIVRAFSAGEKPARSLSKWAVKVMQKNGYNLSIHQIANCVHFIDINFDYVITMDCPKACLFVRTKSRMDWSVTEVVEPAAAEASKINLHIETKVKALVDFIEQSGA